MTDRATLGVVIPTVGDRVDLRRMLESILGQTRPVQAIRIVVDADDTSLVDSIVADLADSLTGIDVEVLTTGAKRGEGVYLVETGYGFAVNRGLERLDTELVAFLDDDDELGASHFAGLEAALDPAAGRGVAYSRVLIRPPSGKDRLFPEGPMPEGRIGIELMIDPKAVLLPATLIHRSVLDRIGNLDESLDRLADTDMLVRLGLGSEIAAVDNPTYVYYRVSRRDVVNERVLAERSKLLRKHQEHLTRRQRLALWDKQARSALRSGLEDLGQEASHQVISALWDPPPGLAVSWYTAIRRRPTPRLVTRFLGGGKSTSRSVSDDPASETTDFAGLVATLQTEFDWPARSDSYTVVDSWARERSGSRFRRIQGEEGSPDLVVKTVDGWDGEDAHHTYDALTGLANLVGGSGLEGTSPVTPLAWSAQPPLVVLPYLEGEDLISILRQPDHPGWEHMPGWMETAGRLLAIFHAAATPENPPTETDEVASVAARYRVPISPVLGEGTTLTARAVRIFGDFGPGNLHGSPEGTLYLLDPPTDPVPGLPHRDLANFVFELRRQLAGHGFTPSTPVLGRFAKLRASFLDGYAARSGVALEQADEALISLYELRRSAGMARKRGASRPGDATWFARQAIQRRREVMALLPRQS